MVLFLFAGVGALTLESLLQNDILETFPVEAITKKLKFPISSDVTAIIVSIKYLLYYLIMHCHCIIGTSVPHLLYQAAMKKDGTNVISVKWDNHITPEQVIGIPAGSNR